ncbi:MAG: AsmA family protein, partial [Chromatiales bacterium]
MLTWIRRILLGVSLLVLAVSAAILLFEPSLNLTSYRGFIARELRQNTGREIQVGGDVHLKLGRYVQIVVHDIRMTNPSWCQAKQQFKVSEAAVGLDLLALFSGIIHLRDLELHDVVAVYEVSTSDEPGCDLKPEAPVASARRQESHPFRLVLENVLFEQASLIVRNPRDNRSLELWLESFKQQNHDGMLVLEANGRVNDLEMRLAGSVGTLDALLHGRHIKVDLQGNLDQIDMTLRGRLGDPRRLEGIELVSTLQGQGFDRLLKTFGVPYQHDGNIDMRLRVMDLQPGFAWSSEGYLGALNIHTQGKLERPLEWDGLQATVDIQGEDLSLLGRFLAVPELPRQAYQLTGQVTRDTDGLVLRDIKLESGEAMIQVSGQFPLFPNLQQAAAQLNVNLPKSSRFTALLGRELGIPGPLRIEASLTPADNGDATVDARLHLSDNQASLQGRLGEYPHYHHTRLDFSLAGPNFGVLAAAGGLNGLPQQAYRLAGEVQIDPDDRLLLQLSQGRLGKLQFVAQGSLGRLPELESADLQVTARGDSLRAIAAGWSEAELPDQPFQLETRLRGKLSAPRIGNLSASLGAARLQVAGSIGLPPDLAGTDAKFEFDVPDMVQLLPASRRARWPGGRYRAIGKIQKSTQALELRDVEVSGQQLKLTLSAAIPDPFRFVDTKLRLKATTPDLAAVMPALPPYHPPKVPASLDAQLQSSRSQLEITSFRVESAETRIEGEGHIALAEQPVEISLVLQATGPRLSDLGVVDGFVLPAESFALSAELRQFGKRLDITDLNARVGQGKFTGKVRVEQRKRPYVEMQARVNRLNMGQFLPPSKPTKGAETDKSASAQSTEARLIPDVEPDLRFLDALDGHFQLRMGELGFPDPVFAGKVLVAELELDARLDSGNLTLDKLWSTGER